MIYILTRSSTNSCYEKWTDYLQHPFSFVNNFDENWTAPEDCSIIITHDTYRPEPCAIIRRSVEHQIPVLILADGILEYRNSWRQKHAVTSGVFNPILGHKLACIGDSQVRFLESIVGNIGKCESVGLPRLEGLANETEKKCDSNLLICSSKTPWFRKEDKLQVIEAFRDLKQYKKDIEQIFNVSLLWRVTQDLANLIDVESSISNPLHVDLSRSCAVVTMPSTVMLESMILGLPVAIVDYTSNPHYVPAAWSITKKDKIISIVRELLTPPKSKLEFQESILKDSLQMIESPSLRLARLVECMINESLQCRLANQPLAFSKKILSQI